jgi:hypothetical protein
MHAVLKNRVVSPLLVLLVLVPLAGAHPADVPLPGGPATSSSNGKVLPRRALRPLSRHDVYQAIQDDLAKKGILGRGNLRPEDLRIQSSVPVVRNDLGLQVKRIGFDPIRRETVFKLWTSNEPQYLPFNVTTRQAPRTWGFTHDLNLGKVVDRSKGSLQGDSAIGRGKNQAESHLPVLAKPGRPATLIMSGQNMRITTTVVPLQPGSKGQCIRVRDPATARIMTAEVVDEGLLRANF